MSNDLEEGKIMMEYKGYIGHVEFDDEADILHGEVLLVRGIITFQGESIHEIRDAFRDSVDDYLEFCKKQNIAPENPLPNTMKSGSLLGRHSNE